ncbi:UNVERIFIED_CONTAM: hypothetical protein HDU68_006471, partial [Siphonaria sp. JEL0065]
LLQAIVLWIPLQNEPWKLILVNRRFYQTLNDPTFVLLHLKVYKASEDKSWEADLAGLYQQIHLSHIYKESTGIDWAHEWTDSVISVFNSLPNLKRLTLVRDPIVRPERQLIPTNIHSETIASLQVTGFSGSAIPPMILPSVSVLRISRVTSKE